MLAVNNTNIAKANEKYICLLREHMIQWGIGTKGLNLLFLFPLITELWKTIEFFLNVSLNSVNSATKIYVITVKGLEPTTSCVGDKDATTVPARHMWETGSLNWAKFMLHWFIRFQEFAEFTEFNISSVPFRKISNEPCITFKWTWSPRPDIHYHEYPTIVIYLHGYNLCLRSTDWRFWA